MKLLAVEAKQWAHYMEPRYRQVEKYGCDLRLLLGVGDESYLPDGRCRVAGSAKAYDLVAAAMAWHAEEHFDGILTFSEMSVIATAVIAEALGLPGIGLDAARNSRNKYLMRQAHQRGGVPIPRFRYVPDLPEALAAAAEFGYPVVLKPTFGSSSSFVFRVDTPEQLEQRFADASEGMQRMLAYQLEVEGLDIGPHGLLVESFLDGNEYLFEALAWDGEVFIGSAVDRVTMEGETFDDDVHAAPTTLDDRQLEEVRSIIAAAAAAHGLRRSTMHAEFRMHRGRPHLVELAARPGGGGLDEVARVTAGYCPVLASMDIARGIRPSVSHYQPTGVHMMGTCLICDEGELEYVSIPPEIAESEYTMLARLTQQPGAVIRRPPNGNNILGFLVVTGDSHSDTKQRLEDYIDQVEVKLAGQPPGHSKTPWARSRPVAAAG